MLYAEYISSDAWKEKRQQRIAFDNGMCAICHDTDGLSVHHLHYDSLGNEDIQRDLITACTRCHRHLDTIERYNRYNKRKRQSDTINIQIHERCGSDGLENREIQVDISLPNAHAQSRDGGSARQVVQGDETDFIKTRENRR